MVERNCDHCVSPMMAICIVSFGQCFQSTVHVYASVALKWLFEIYDPMSVRWKHFRKHLAETLIKRPNLVQEVDWVQTYKSEFPSEWKEIENVVEKLRSKSHDDRAG